MNGARQGWGAVETSQASLEAVRAQLAQAEKALADATIRAPFDGFITARPVAAGEWVSNTSKIATIVKVGLLKLQLQVPEQRAAQVKTGMTVNARVAAWPGREFTGTVTAINPSVDPNSRVFILEAQFTSPAAELRPGMFAVAKVLLPGGENAVFVPRQAVLRDRTTDSYQVYAVENGTARLKVVVPGESDNAATRIASGLTGNETVATSHLDQLFDGVPVVARNQ
jgi:RND family efflux transporter MFP subunit